LLAVPEYDAVVYRSARNIVNVRVMPVAELNAYDLLRQRNLLVVKSALESFVSQGQAVGAGA
jgi:ribosomal protein L4